jgi:GNAT superfamily N-acetyltransferase
VNAIRPTVTRSYRPDALNRSAMVATYLSASIRRVMASAEQIVLEAVSPGTARARRVLWSYIDEVASRYYGRQATDREIDRSIREGPSDALTPPHGLFLLAQQESADLGCVGLRFRPGRIGEVTRLFVLPAARGCGLGSRLMNEIETLALEHGVAALRLDTRDDLVEARRLYARLGYREVDPFKDGPYPDH